MFSKLYSKGIAFLKKNISLILSLVIFYFIVNFPLPYYVHSTGGLIDIADKVTIEDEYKIKGGYYFTYVSEFKGNLLTTLLAYVLPDFDLVENDEIKSPSETHEEVSFRNNLFLTEANQNALFLAFNKADKYVKINERHHYIVYIDEMAKTNLSIKDELLAVNDITFDDAFQYLDIIRKSEVGEELKLKVKTKEGLIENKKIEVIVEDGYKITGIYFVTKYDYLTNPKIKFNFKESETGPSGGLMMALTIYNKLINQDITKGRKIVGTGTIDQEGCVGEVGGIAYKLKGAVNKGADIFLLPMENYEEALDLKRTKGYNIEIIGVSTFDDAINYLMMFNL